MRAAAILGLGCSPRRLRPFQDNPPQCVEKIEWQMGMPASADAANVILLFGGDGTIHRHLGALVRLGLPVLIVPAGSGNDFARAVGLPRMRDSLAAWQKFCAGAENVRAIDLGVISSGKDAVPAPHDPDSFIKANGGEAFRKLVENAEGFFDYLLNRLCSQNDPNSDKGRNTVVRGMAEAVHKTGNVVLTDTHAQKTALRLGVSPEAVRAEFSKLKVQGAGFKVPDSEAGEPTLNVEPETLNRPSAQEFWLLKLLLLHDELVAWAALHLDVNWISHSAARQIVEHRLAAQTNETWKNLAAFLDGCETPEMRSLVTEAVAEDRKIPNPDQQLADVTLKLRNQFLDRQIAALTQKVGLPETSEAGKVELLREQQKLREQKRAPLK